MRKDEVLEGGERIGVCYADRVGVSKVVEVSESA